MLNNTMVKFNFVHTRWRVFGVGDWAWQQFTEGPAATGAVISNLQSKIRYEVKVAAFTKRGEGTYMSASVTTIESPGNFSISMKLSGLFMFVCPQTAPMAINGYR